jgi:hypothetical protein
MRSDAIFRCAELDAAFEMQQTKKHGVFNVIELIGHAIVLWIGRFRQPRIQYQFCLRRDDTSHRYRIDVLRSEVPKRTTSLAKRIYHPIAHEGSYDVIGLLEKITQRRMNRVRRETAS